MDSVSLGNFRFSRFLLLGAACFLVPNLAHAQDVATSAATPVPSIAEDSVLSAATATGEAPPMMADKSGEFKKAKEHVESELIIEGMASYGNWQIFAAGYDCKLYDAGVEYNRHSWGQHFGAHFDYVAEFLPLVLLNEPAKLNFYGIPRSKNRTIVPGIGITPIGLRMQWRSNRKIKPYMEVKGGGLLFSQKALSPDATYENFSFNTAIGVQVRMSDRWGLRLGLFSDMHFSNAFIHDSNPGLDTMNSNLGLSYHFK
jgi:hypothetical protein